MSRLWSKLRSKMWPAPKHGVGLSLSRHGLWAAYASDVGTRREVRWVRHETTTVPLFQGAPPANAAHQLADVLARLCEQLKREFVPIQIALPDPAVSVRVLELETLPGSARERAALVRWRFEKDLSAKADTLACAWQDLGRADGKPLLLALAVDQGWLECVTEACRLANLFPAAIDMSACYQFNRYYAILATGAGSGAFILFERYAWTLFIWDDQKRPRLARSRWRQEDSESSGAEYELIALELERTVRAYVHGEKGRTIERVFVTGSDADIEGVTRILDGRMRHPCTRLPADSEFSFRPDAMLNTDTCPGAALAAAIAR